MSPSSAIGFHILFPNYFLWNKTSGVSQLVCDSLSCPQRRAPPLLSSGTDARGRGEPGGHTAPPHPPPPRARLRFSGAGGETLKRAKGSTHRRPPASVGITDPARPCHSLGTPLRGPPRRPQREARPGEAGPYGHGSLSRPPHVGGWGGEGGSAPRPPVRGGGLRPRARGGKSPSPPPHPPLPSSAQSRPHPP